MRKSQVPRGVKAKHKCKKCGHLFYPIVITGSTKITEECPVCNPKPYNVTGKK